MRRDQARGRCGVYDCAETLLRDELTDLGAHAQPYAFKIDGDDLVELVFIVICGFALCACDSRIVEGAIKPPECFYCRRDQRFDVLCVRHVASDELRLASDVANSADGLLATLFGHIGDDHSRTFTRENDCCRPADSRRRTCYQRAFASE